MEVFTVRMTREALDELSTAINQSYVLSDGKRIKAEWRDMGNGEATLIWTLNEVKVPR